MLRFDDDAMQGIGVSGSGSKRPWTTEDDLVMEKLYPATKIQILMEILDRSARSIRLRASFLKVPKCKIFRSKQQSDGGKGRHGKFPKLEKPIRERVAPIIKISKETRQMMAGMEGNIEALDAAGQFVLANITREIIERIKASSNELNLDFLTIREG